MSALLRARAAVRVVALMALVALCSGGTVVQSAPPLPSGLQIDLQTGAQPDTVADVQPGTQIAALTPTEAAPTEAAPTEAALPPGPAAPDRGPFGTTVAHDGAMSAKWRGLQPAIQLEALILDLCRTDRKLCPPAAARFLAIVEAARNRSGRARIGKINQAINLAIRPMSDATQYQVGGVWMTPLMTFATGAGDCKDYAIAKYVALREAGVAPEDLRIVILRIAGLNQDHAVTAARVDGQWYILDNRHMILLTDSQITNMTPLVAIDHEDIRRSAAAAS
jgi:predicted transglutaminase-like cysteine proteinase